MNLERLNELFEYNDQTGILTYKISEYKSKAKVGIAVGSPNDSGYLRVNVDGKSQRVHRIAYYMRHGVLPKFIDHIDGNTSNNKIKNLRSCSQSENNYNQKIRKNNSSGLKGVSWSKQRKMYEVKLSVNKKSVYVGRYKTIISAKIAIMKARKELHGDFAKH